MRISHLGLSFLFFIISPILRGQDTVKTREVIANYPGCQERYSVKVSNGRIWHGKFTYTYGKVVMMEGFYFNDMMDGNWKYFYRSGKLKHQVVFSKGIYVKSLGEYYENGNLKCSDSVSGKKEIVKRFTQMSELYKETVYFNKTRIRVTYYYLQSGKPRVVIMNDQDTAVTKITRYYENGTVRSVLLKRNDLPYTGLGAFDPDGRPIDQGNLSEGNGTLITYQDTSFVLLESKFAYKDQKKNGEAICYFTNGKIGRKGTYLNDGYSGKWEYYKPTGKLDFKRDFQIHDHHPVGADLSGCKCVR